MMSIDIINKKNLELINNVSNILDKNNIFKHEEIIDINLMIDDLFKEYIEKNILSIMNPNFDEKLTNHIYDNIIEQLIHLYNNMLSKTKNKIKRLISKRKFYLYSRVIPRRFQKTSFIRDVKPNIEKLTKQIKILQDIPQPEQRTEDWYIFRHNLLTASSIWKAFGSQSSKNQLIYEKCKPYSLFNSPSMDSPLHWGQKYEPVSVEFYEKMYDTKISDFGCIKHNKYPFIGASPDGINTKLDNSRYGRMLEIKNIVNRVINGNPKTEYWIQMQLQMETCELNECDFLETKFIEYPDEESFILDGTFTKTHDDKTKGVMILFSDNGKIYYEYAPLGITCEEYEEWEKRTLEKNEEKEWVKNIYWKLEKYSNILVLRNKEWFKQSLPQIEELWNIVLEERVTGYQHRGPKKRKQNNQEITSNKCFINVSKLE